MAGSMGYIIIVFPSSFNHIIRLVFSCVKPQTKAHKVNIVVLSYTEEQTAKRTLIFFNLPSFESEMQSGLGRMELNGQIIDCHEKNYRIYIAVWLAFSFISMQIPLSRTRFWHNIRHLVTEPMQKPSGAWECFIYVIGLPYIYI